jgi:hypothetical protein
MRGFLQRIARLERLASAVEECVVRIRYFDATSGELLLDRRSRCPPAPLSPSPAPVWLPMREFLAVSALPAARRQRALVAGGR